MGEGSGNSRGGSALDGREEGCREVGGEDETMIGVTPTLLSAMQPQPCVPPPHPH